MIYSFQSWIPVVHPTSFVHPQAVVIGNVVIGKQVYVGPGAVLRGDWGLVQIGDGSNVQENCVLHMFPGKSVVLSPSAHIGHGAIIHGAFIGENALIGMNAVVMDDAEVGAGSVIGALSFVKAGMVIPPRMVYAGNPAEPVRPVTEEMLEWKTAGTSLYQALPQACFNELKPCEPLTALEENRPIQEISFKTWKETRSNS